MRHGLRAQCGIGWTVVNHKGSVRLSVRFDDGQRTTAVTSLPWAGDSLMPLLNLAAGAKGLMLMGRGLADAVALLSATDSDDPTAAVRRGQVNWSAVAQRFEQHKTGTGAVKGSTFREMYAPVVAKLMTVLEASPRPTCAAQALEALTLLPSGRGGTEPPLPPGSRGRKLLIQYAAQVLRYAVDECGAPSRWMPPASLANYIGRAPKRTLLTTPIKDHQIVRLLAGISNPQWRTAVGLVAAFGLRPVELAYLSSNGRFLHCGYAKRTARGDTLPRDIVGLDPEGLEGLSADLLAQLAERGEDALPPAVLRFDAEGNRTAGGQALQQYLNRLPIWQELVAEVAAVPPTGNAGNELVPYSLRHGYALRAHERFGLSQRKAAGLMGHSVPTHGVAYGCQVDQEVLFEAADQADAVIARRRLEALV